MAAGGGNLSGARDGLGAHQGEPHATIRSEALLWGEVVHIKFGRVNQKSTGTTGGIKGHQGIGVGANNARGLDGHTG
ncbi:unannotated protein [freshwater metagenome]|uniref:Unannotated protein n=1 Tax=freshwater metagenome TaxID=449393 RepID=A0A6J6C1U9_9ZZZZ